MKFLLFISLISLLFFSGCSTKEEIIPKEEKAVEVIPTVKPSTENMKAVSFSEIEGFYKDDLNHALDVFKKDCKASKKNELFKEVCQDRKSVV